MLRYTRVKKEGLSGIPLEREHFDHVMRVIPQFCLTKTGYTQIAFPIDIRVFFSQQCCRFGIDYFIDPFAFR